MVILIGKSIEKYFVSEEEANTFDLFVKSEQISKQVINILLFEGECKVLDYQCFYFFVLL